MTDEGLDAGARLLHAAWRDGGRIEHLSAETRPSTRSDGYRLQARLVALTGDRPIGWKIAATSVAGQRHIGVTGPLAGRILASRAHRTGTTVGIATNALRVAEAEFGFRMARAVDGVPGRDIEVASVLEAVEALVPAIELPDARFLDVPNAGEAQLIADLACAGPVVLGTDAPESWRTLDLASHEVAVSCNGAIVTTGRGANALGLRRATSSLLGRVSFPSRWWKVRRSSWTSARLARCRQPRHDRLLGVAEGDGARGEI